MADCIWVGGNGAGETDPTVGANWSTNVVPAIGEDVYIPKDAAYNIIGGDLTGPALASFTIEDGCALSIGSLAAYLKIELDGTGPITDWGVGARYLFGTDSGQWNLFGSGTVYIDGDDNDELTIGNGGANVYVGPDIAAAGAAPTPAEFDVIKIIKSGTVRLDHFQTQAAGAVPIHHIQGGTVRTLSAVTDVYQSGGTWYHERGALANYYGTGGKLYYMSPSTPITSFIVENNGKIDFSRDNAPITVTTGHVYRGGSVLDPYGRVTWTNDLELNRCSLAQVTVDLGENREYAVTDL